MNEPRNMFSDSYAQTGVGAAYNEGLRKYMLGVYNYMALGIAATALVAMYFSQNVELAYWMRTNTIGIWAPFIAILGLGFIGPKMIFSGSTAVAHGIYWAYVAAWGLLIGPVVGIFAGAGLASMVFEAFFITSAVFGALSLYGYTTKKDLSGWGKFLFMASIGLLIALLANFFIFKSGMFSLVISSLVVLVFSAVTAYETQMIKNLYAEGHDGANARAGVFGAFMLYGTFATLFLHILNILSRLRGN